MALVTVRDVEKDYRLGETTVHAIRGVSLEIDPGEFVSIVGPSGCGKTTLLNMIGCIDKPSSGTVRFDDHDVVGLSDAQAAQIRLEHIGFVFQSFNLVPVLNVYENVEFPLLLGKDTATKAERGEYIAFLMEEVGLTDWRNHRPNELSGGQRQRVAIARALVTKPQIVLADEPTANLDSKTGGAIIELMKKINRDLDTTFIFSTHDPSIVDIADHVIRLQDGLVIEDRRVARSVGANA